LSEIDQYDYRCLGIAACPSRYEPRSGWGRIIALYRFDSETTDELDSFQAKRGDLVLGGGGGECGALRISLPQAILFFTDIDWNGWQTADDIVKSYWTPTEAFIFGDGFVQLGWHPSLQGIEMWLAEHIVEFLLREYRSDYEQYIGPESSIEQDGSIC
jgi:hypothetical protein